MPDDALQVICDMLQSLETLPSLHSVVTETRLGDSAVRITDPDSGLQAVCDSYQSQTSNKVMALLQILHSLEKSRRAT
ncbi:MAG: hypothetical protein JWP89_6526 [Schlesneria sp.]|nr:hypothetical protein [Schlesneria sp.]